MAAMVLNSPRAVQVSVYVVRAFVRLRRMLPGPPIQLAQRTPPDTITVEAPRSRCLSRRTSGYIGTPREAIQEKSVEGRSG